MYPCETKCRPLLLAVFSCNLMLASQLKAAGTAIEPSSEYRIGPSSQCTLFHEQQVKSSYMLNETQEAGWQVIGELTDPDDLATGGGMDIRRAWIEQSGLRLRLSIETRQPIRTDYVSLTDAGVFLWLIDADQNPDTGQPHT